MPSWKKQLYLAIALFILGTGAYWLEFTHRPKKEKKEEDSKKVLLLAPRNIQSIAVDAGTRSFELKCTGFEKKECHPGDNSSWQVTSLELGGYTKPTTLKGDDSNANALVSSLNNLSAAETISLKDDTAEKRAALLKEYGLDPESLKAPTARKLTVVTDAGPMRVYLGGSHPIGEGIFALREEGGKLVDTLVYVVPSHFGGNFDHDLTYWRNKKLFDFAVADVTSFSVESPKGKVSGTKKENDWSLGESLPGDTEAIEALLSAISYLTARDFPKAATATGKPALKLTLATKKSPSLSLSLFERPSGVRGKQVFASVSTADTMVELESGALDRLSKGLKDLRMTKLLTSLERYSIKRIALSGKSIGTPPQVLVAKDAKWVFESGAPGSSAPSTEKIQALLEKLSGNRIRDFLGSGAVPADALKISLGDEKSAEKRRYAFWKKGDDLLAKDLTSKRGEVLKVEPAVSTDLPWTRGHFAAAAPAAFASPAPKAAK